MRETIQFLIKSFINDLLFVRFLIRKTKQFLIKSFIRGALFFLFLVIIGFGLSFFQNMLDGVFKILLNPFGISWILNFPMISIVLFVIAAVLTGSLLAVKSVRAKIKTWPLVSIPIKFSESIE